MDQEGVRKLYEKRQGRQATDEERRIISLLTVRDCVRIWEDLAFSTGEVDLMQFVEQLAEEAGEDDEDLPPLQKKIISDVKKVHDAIKRIAKDTKDKDGFMKAKFRDLKADDKLRIYIDNVAGTCRLGRKKGMLFFASRDLQVGKDDDEKVFLIEAEPKKKIDVKKKDGDSKDAAPEAAGGGKKVEVAGAAPAGRRLRGGSIKQPVTGEEVSKLCQILARMQKENDDEPVTYGLLRKDPTVKENFATKLPAVCGLGKKEGRIVFETDDLWPEKDDKVVISLGQS